MNDKLRKLGAEFQKGQRQLELLDQRRQELRDTILRISGAIQVLEELQTKAASELELREKEGAAA